MSRSSEPQTKRRKIAPHIEQRRRPLRQEIQDSAARGFKKIVRNHAQNAGSEDAELSSEPPSDEDSGFREDDEADSLESTGEDFSPDDSDVSEGNEKSPQNELQSISFGALADAQDALPQANDNSLTSKQLGSGPEKTDKLKALRERLGELHAKSTKQSNISTEGKEHKSSIAQRTSKHAPPEQTSRRQVSRYRDVVDTSHIFDPNKTRQKLQGDPRFNAAAGSIDHEKVRRTYAFLNDYAEKELQDLKNTLAEGKKRKRGKMSEDEQAELKKEIVRRENRLKAIAKKNRERDVALEHKRGERQKVQEGKKPFFLKKGQIKEEAKSQQQAAMKTKDKEKSEQRKRRRQEQKEMKRRPGERRTR